MIQTIIGKDFPNVVIPLVNSAKNSIEIIVFDWRWYPQDLSCAVQLFNQVVIGATRRGVNVRVIANHEEIIKILNENGCSAKKLMTPHLVHSKLMIIDSKIVICGSHNYTQAAFTLNYETSVCFEDSETALIFQKHFNNLFNSYGHY